MINYGLIADSLNHYESIGFKRIESPWLVSKAISDITKPEEVNTHEVVKGNKKKVFVASGEQSFLYLINKGFLPHGKYQTVTPCMRDDDFGAYHTKYFVKNELIVYADDLTGQCDYMIDVAWKFFKDRVPNRNELKICEYKGGYDIEYKGLELGSYGVRECPFARWVYGTGLAEPRFSRVIL